MSDVTTTVAATATAAGATDFQRTRSKVWFPCADDDYDDVDDAAGHRRPHGSPWRRRQPSTSPDSCRRVSSGSPSNGSHRSQDSGFSDSESGGGGGGGGNSPPGPSNGNVRPGQSATDRLPDEERSAAEKACRGSAVVAAALEPPCDCFLPACELSRKFRSYEHVTAAASPPFIKHPGADLQRSSSPHPPSRTPNRTCFIVDELPKSPKAAAAAAVVVGSDGSLPPPPPPSQATPSSAKSFDGNFDRSTNVTVVENVVVADGSPQRDHHPIIEPPAPFDDDRHDFDSSDGGPDGPPVHASTPKSAKTRCCTPGPCRGKELQLRKAEPDTFDR